MTGRPAGRVAEDGDDDLGVLALQGDVREHVAALESLGERVRLVREPADVEGLAGLIIPGGESTTLSMLLESSGLFEPLAEALSAGLPVFGTCAGMILLADDGARRPRRPAAVRGHRPDHPPQRVRPPGGLLRVRTSRCPGSATSPVHAVFIRAPVVERAGPQVEVLATLLPARRAGPGTVTADGPPQPVVCRQGPVLTTSFHPELTGDRRLHQLFVEMTKEERR